MVGGGIVGVLIEQARWRSKEPGQRLPPVANVLYAAPIRSVLLALGIVGPPDADVRLEALRKQMGKIKVIEGEIDPERAREVRKEAVFRYVFGE